MTGWNLKKCCRCNEQLAPDDFDGICSECDAIEEAEMNLSAWDRKIIATALNMRANVIETGNYALSANDCIARKMSINAIDDDQRRLVARLRELAEEFAAAAGAVGREGESTKQS